MSGRVTGTLLKEFWKVLFISALQLYDFISIIVLIYLMSKLKCRIPKQIKMRKVDDKGRNYQEMSFCVEVNYKTYYKSVKIILALIKYVVL